MAKGSVVEVGKEKCVFDLEPPRKAWVSLSQHLLHLDLVANHNYSNICSRFRLHLLDYGVNYSCLIRVVRPCCSRTTGVEGICLVNDENIPISRSVGDEASRSIAQSFARLAGRRAGAPIDSRKKNAKNPRNVPDYVDSGTECTEKKTIFLPVVLFPTTA